MIFDLWFRKNHKLQFGLAETMRRQAALPAPTLKRRPLPQTTVVSPLTTVNTALWRRQRLPERARAVNKWQCLHGQRSPGRDGVQCTPIRWQYWRTDRPDKDQAAGLELDRVLHPGIRPDRLDTSEDPAALANGHSDVLLADKSIHVHDARQVWTAFCKVYICGGDPQSPQKTAQRSEEALVSPTGMEGFL